MQGATEKCLHRLLLRRLLAFLGAARLEIDAAISFMGLTSASIWMKRQT